MDLIIDTCIFIETERQGALFDFNQLKKYENVYTTAITASELLVGIHYATTKARQLKRTAFIEGILQSIPILDFTVEAARIHAELYVHLAKRGEMISAHDLFIAAIAISQDCALLTGNTREFERIPGLTLINSKSKAHA